ncbi:MAG TPA: hypothetical protein VGN74_05430 [Brevundimonas sp.]|jgi:hypothetical protein|uniref:hypothetical protein n=1 Tax=Brevundimonas sp. TaxID=1871086 RepID=UPI002E153E69|nr:hypothetical protein [Brevundimonas sp.]
MNRQQARRIAFKEAKRVMARVAANRAALELSEMRAARIAPVKQGPGKLISSARPFKKPRATNWWRTRKLDRLPCGQPVPAGCEAWAHTTKGLRVQRVVA